MKDFTRAEPRAQIVEHTAVLSRCSIVLWLLTTCSQLLDVQFLLVLPKLAKTTRHKRKQNRLTINTVQDEVTIECEVLQAQYVN